MQCTQSPCWLCPPMLCGCSACACWQLGELTMSLTHRGHGLTRRQRAAGPQALRGEEQGAARAGAGAAAALVQLRRRGHRHQVARGQEPPLGLRPRLGSAPQRMSVACPPCMLAVSMDAVCALVKGLRLCERALSVGTASHHDCRYGTDVAGLRGTVLERFANSSC